MHPSPPGPFDDEGHNDDPAARIARDVLAHEVFAALKPAAPREIRFRSGQEVFETAPEEVPWIWEGYLATGLVTLLAGRHKGGKSTMLFGFLRAMVDGHDEFLGHAIESGPVVLLTEEGPETLRPKLEPITPEGRERLRVLCRTDVTPRAEFAWRDAIREAGVEAVKCGSKVVVVDTFAFWSQIKDENDNSLMQEVVSALGELTNLGLSVVVVHHHRKGGGEDGDAIRGGTGLLGAVDIIVEMVRPAELAEEDATTERELRCIGRFTHPEAMRIRLDGDGVYRRIGEGTRSAMKQLSADGKVRNMVREQYPDTPTTDDICEETSVPKTTVLRVLHALEKDGLVESFSEGQRGKKRWRWEPEPYPRGPLNGG